jgi:hypothetical protein
MTKILSLLSFALILLSLIVVAQNPGVQGYEISIYNEYPTLFWFLIICSIFINQIILILHVGSDLKSSISWKIAIIGIIMANSIIFLLPLIRRYALMGSGDPATHMGLIIDILHTGSIGANAYPINHILVCITHWVCGLELNICMMLYPFIFYSLYIVSFYLLLRTLLKDQPSVLVGMTLVTLLIIGDIHFTPQAESNFFLPFVLYIYFLRYSGKNTLNYSILIIITSIAITFYHPLTTLYLIFSFSIFYLVSIMYKKFNIKLDININNSWYIIIILIITFFMWQSYVVIILGTFRKVYEWLYEESTQSSMFERYAEQINRIQPDPSYLLNSFIYAYGHDLLYVIMGIISVFIILSVSKKCKKITISSNFSAFSIIFIICALFGYGSSFIVMGTGFGRVLEYALFASIFLISTAFGYLIKKFLHPLKLLAIFSIVLLILTYLNVFTLYLSPINKYPGQHVTDSQFIGISTFQETRNENLRLLQGGLNVYRMKDALFGRRIELKNIIFDIPEIPDHFGYREAAHFGNSYRPRSMYLVIGTLFRISNQMLIPEYPELWRFNQMDFLMLENDVTVAKTYSNRQLDIYLLNPNFKEFSINEESINN